MFGVNMLVRHRSQEVLLRAFTKEDLTVLVQHFSSMKVHMMTKGLFAQTLENEQEWYDKRRVDPDTCAWAIQPSGSKVPIGITALHDLTDRRNSAVSGIIIWDPEWWGKGIASTTHLARTMFAADFLNRWTIKSTVRKANVASRKALEGVGYSVWGEEPVADYRGGAWLDSYHLKWIRPDVAPLLFPDGLTERFVSGIKKAQTCLDRAREVVEFV